MYISNRVVKNMTIPEGRERERERERERVGICLLCTMTSSTDEEELTWPTVRDVVNVSVLSPKIQDVLASKILHIVAILPEWSRTREEGGRRG